MNEFSPRIELVHGPAEYLGGTGGTIGTVDWGAGAPHTTLVKNVGARVDGGVVHMARMSHCSVHSHRGVALRI